jgi:hypothetical protein
MKGTYYFIIAFLLWMIAIQLLLIFLRFGELIDAIERIGCIWV